MAVFKQTQTKLETTNGLDLIWESRTLYDEILFSFRECHDLCLKSELFTKDIILQIDQCAVDFRQLSLDTVTVAKRVSNQWLDTAIVFFEEIDDVDDPQEMLKLLGGQARELAQCFNIIAAWGRDLAWRFHKAQDGTLKEAENFNKAKLIASQAATFVEVQGKLEGILEAVSAFWIMEAEDYNSQGAKMASCQAKMIKFMKGKVVKDNLEFWTKAKNRMDQYVTAMSVINNCLNFVTDARPLVAQSFGLPNLELTLHVPSNIDVKKAIGM